MSDGFSPQPVASWFMLAALTSLLVTGAFCILFIMHLMADPAMMPLDQRLAYEATPTWVTGAFGIGSVAGFIGGLLLVMRRRQSEAAMILALAGMLVWLAGSIAVAPLRNAMSANDLAVIIVMLIVTWTIFWFARHSRMRGWLQ